MTPPLSLRAFGHRLLAALLICCVTAGALWVAVLHVEDVKVAQIQTADIPRSLLRAGGNYLIIGSDTRAFVDTKADAEAFGSKQTQTGQRSDTIMVAHLDPGGRTGVLVSFPRDLWVPIPGHGTAKINAAFAYGGAQLTIKTIEEDFGVPISHYLEVDFEGFRDIVNAIGTVPIYFPAPARDKNSGLAIATAGCHDLSGSQALAYVRSRYYQYYADGKWQDDPTSDLGRIRRQQYFIRSLSRAAIKTVLAHPLRVNSVLDKTVSSLTRDELLNASDLRALVLAFRDTNPDDFPMYTLPAAPSFVDSQSVLLLDAAQAAPTLARLRGAPAANPTVPDMSPAAVRLTVENGSGVTGAAARAVDRLRTDRFKIGAPASDADRSDYAVTEVRYGPGAQSKARLVLSFLGGVGRLVALRSVPAGLDVVVVLGQDFRQVTIPAAPTAAASHGAAAVTTTTGPEANPGGAMPLAGC
jgi:LCP family protein required for cell wall assembly